MSPRGEGNQRPTRTQSPPVIKALSRIRVLTLAYLCLVPLLSAHAQTIRVGLLRKDPPVSISIQGPCRVGRSSGSFEQVRASGWITLRSGEGGVVISGQRTPSPRHSIRVEPASPRGAVVIRADSGQLRPYRGSLTIRASAGRLLIVDVVEIEDYVRSVLPSEMPCDWPVQTLAAQAVVARSFATAEKRRHASEGFDLCDLTHCQVYRGASWERPQTDRAVAMTRGLILTCHGRCIPAPYHSTCGGMTTDGLYASHLPETYLAPVSDADPDGRPACSASPHSRWTTVLSPGEIADALGQPGRSAAPITDVRVLSRDRSGRVTMLRVNRRRITGYDFMLAVDRRLGWNRIKSTLFDARRSGRGFILTGRGLGHGMGLCQWGARGMAASGQRYQQVLHHYYPRCVVAHVER